MNNLNKTKEENGMKISHKLKNAQGGSQSQSQGKNRKIHFLFEFLKYVTKRFGVRRIFGVPGDYTMPTFNKYVEENTEFQFIATPCELDAAFSAISYSRKMGIGLCMSIYGVNGAQVAAHTLAMNVGIPMINIVFGSDTSNFVNGKRKGYMLHHYLRGKKNNQYALSDTFNNVCLEVLKISDDDINEKGYLEVLRVIELCYMKKGPVMIVLPCYKVNQEINISAYLVNNGYKSFRLGKKELKYIDKVKNELSKAKTPIIVLGLDGLSHNVGEKVEEFSEKCKIPVVTLFDSKGGIDERFKYYAGNYVPWGEHNRLKEFVKNADFALIIGEFNDEVNTVKGSIELPENRMCLNPSIESKYASKEFHMMIRELIDCSHNIKFDMRKIPKLDIGNNKPDVLSTELFKGPGDIYLIMNDLLKDKRTSYCIDSGDHLMSSYMYENVEKNCMIHSCGFIYVGCGVAFTFGCATAVKEMKSDDIVVGIVGDGGFQLNFQAISSAIRYRIPLILVVIDNSGWLTVKGMAGERKDFLLFWNYSNFDKIFEKENFKTYSSNNPKTFHKSFTQAIKDYKNGNVVLIHVKCEKKFSPYMKSFLKLYLGQTYIDKKIESSC